ncbi:MAG: hypothetical protein ABW221_26475 [Vicinamibacteria bacterium]
MAGLDEAVANLERFIGKLTEATGVLGDVGEHLDEKAREFAQLEQAAGEDGDTVSGHLDEAQDALESARGEAEEALADLEHAAGEGARSMSEAKDQADQSASDLEDKVRTALADVDEAHQSLASDGFQALGQALDELEQQMQAEANETVQALDAMVTDVQGLAQEAEMTWQEAESAADVAAAVVAAAESAVESGAGEGTTAFEAAAVEAESQCASIGQELEALYGALQSTVAAEGGAWDQAIEHLARALVTILEDGGRERLDEPAELLGDEAFDALDREYDTVAAGLGAAETTATELLPLADELVRSRSVVGEVSELLKALGG